MVKESSVLTRCGGWVPEDFLVSRSLIRELAKNAALKMQEPWKQIHPVPHTDAVANFKSTILADPEMTDQWHQIFHQAALEDEIHDFDHLAYILDEIITSPPKFHIITATNGAPTGEPIGVPIYVLLAPLSNTSAGYDLFRKPAFNHALKDLLNAWGRYLMSPSSTATLNSGPEGWFGHLALADLASKGRGDFNSTYVCPDPGAENRGFASWDAFFTRAFQPGVRPVLNPEDKTVIHNACESSMYRIAKGVKAHDRFWLKGQPYSVCDMLNRDEKARSFVGGTVYQGFLSPQDYHRWHCPVDGLVVDAQLIPGTYFAALPGLDSYTGDSPAEQNLDKSEGPLSSSQAWLTHHSTRAVVYIQADNPVIGLVAFMAVGMAEVSTCEIGVERGQKVSAGTELGMFHFGGSSHAVLFGPQVHLELEPRLKVGQHVKLHAVIARARAA